MQPHSANPYKSLQAVPGDCNNSTYLSQEHPDGGWQEDLIWTQGPEWPSIPKNILILSFLLPFLKSMDTLSFSHTGWTF